VPGKRRRRKFALYAVAALVAAITAGALLITSAVDGAVRGRISMSPSDAPSAPLALVLGAEVYQNGHPSPALVNRLDTSIRLFRAGKVKGLLMSGGHGSVETAAMQRYALAAGIPADAIQLDDGGLRTLSSCQRARDVFHAARITVVSQAEHLTWAVYTCNKLGLDAIGVVAPRLSWAGVVDLQASRTGCRSPRLVGGKRSGSMKYRNPVWNRGGEDRTLDTLLKSNAGLCAVAPSLGGEAKRPQLWCAVPPR
jgi:vancomycin permeability regulator SanA